MRWYLRTVPLFFFHVFLGAAFLASTPTFAGSIVLGTSGWGASWDNTFDDPNGNPLLVNIVVNAENATQVFIEKTATFIQGPDPNTGLFPTIPINFQQIAPTTVTQIVIEDEVITNNTGHDWTDFHFVVVGGGAVFNRTLTDASTPTGFFTSPFDTQKWMGQISPDLYTEFWVDGLGLGSGGSNAIIPSGDQWFPGNGASNGELYIDVVPTGFTSFTLKETPTFIPEPSTIALMIFGSIGCMRLASHRRREFVSR